MLAQQFRFHGHGSLRYLYQHGKAVRTQAVVVRYIHNPRRQHSRYTVVVSRKVLKAAPKRNRVRRRIYEYIRMQWENLAHPYDVAITVHDPALLVLPAPELQKILSDTLSKANLWQVPPK